MITGSGASYTRRNQISFVFKRQKYRIKIFDEDLAKDKYFRQMLILFGASIKFHDELREGSKRRYEFVESGGEYLPSTGERGLKKNPRRRIY